MKLLSSALLCFLSCAQGSVGYKGIFIPLVTSDQSLMNEINGERSRLTATIDTIQQTLITTCHSPEEKFRVFATKNDLETRLSSLQSILTWIKEAQPEVSAIAQTFTAYKHAAIDSQQAQRAQSVSVSTKLSLPLPPRSSSAPLLKRSIVSVIQEETEEEINEAEIYNSQPALIRRKLFSPLMPRPSSVCTPSSFVVSPPTIIEEEDEAIAFDDSQV